MGSPDRPRFRGPQDRRLEIDAPPVVGRRPVARNDKNRTFERLVTEIGVSTLMTQRSQEGSEDAKQAAEAMATVRDEARATGFNFSLLRDVAQHRIDERRQAEERHRQEIARKRVIETKDEK